MKLLILILSSAIFQTTYSSALIENENRISRGFDAKSMLSSLAQGIMSRGFTSAGGTQVVSLNLTNLLVLVLLKALIFAAGTLGSGHWKGRSVEEEPVVTDDEILLYLSYLSGNYDCLKNVACYQPEQGKKYAAAGDMLLKMSKLFSVDPDEDYKGVLRDLEEAADFGIAGGNCEKFMCEKDVNS